MVSTSTGIKDQVKLTGSWLKQTKGCGSLTNPLWSSLLQDVVDAS